MTTHDKQAAAPAIGEAAGSPAEIQQEVQAHRQGLWRGYSLLALSLGAFLLFGLMAFLVRGLAPLSVDVSITQAVQNATLSPSATGHTIPVYDELMEIISLPGFWPYNLILPALIVGALLLLRRWAEAALATVALAGGQLFTETIKAVLARPRPTVDLVRIEQLVGGYSFPSGHVVGYVCIYGCLFYLAWSLMKRSWQRTAILIVTGGLVALVGLSRIYEGHHWASDVLGGYGLGFGWLGLCLWAYRRWEAWHLARLQQAAAASTA